MSPSLVPAAASAAFPVVFPAVPSSVSTTMFNPQSFPPHQALGPSIAPNVAPPCTPPSVPQLPLFAQAQVPQLATIPAAQGNQTFPGTPSLFFSQYLVLVPAGGVAVPGCVGSWPLVRLRIPLTIVLR